MKGKTMKTYWVVWNNEDKGEGVLFDDYNDAYQTSTGEFQLISPTVGEAFFEAYELGAPLPVEKIELPA